MNTEKCKLIKEEIIENFSKLSYNPGDLSDFGNEIGYIIAKYFDEEDMGFDKDSFLSGLKHGISLVDGTHL